MIVLLELALAAGSATLVGALLYRMLRHREPEPEEAQGEDPFAPVGAPKRPRPPNKAASVALEEPDEDER